MKNGCAILANCSSVITIRSQHGSESTKQRALGGKKNFKQSQDKSLWLSL